MAYTIKCDGYILDDIRDDELTVSDPEIELEVNTVGGGSFTIHQNHPYYDKLKKLKSVFEVSDDVGVIFRGRMTEDSVDFHNSKAVDLEGAMAYFNDSTVRPFSFPEDFANNAEYATAAASGNVVAFFLKWLIDRHNAQVQEFQRFKLGNVTVSDPNNYLSRSSTEYASTWETLKSKLFDSALGGYLCIRYESDGNYIDYLSEFTLTNTQEIVFGENLLDMKSTGSATGTYSAMIPLGAQLEAQDDAAGTRRRLTIESIADGNITTDVVKSGDVIYSKSAVESFGWVCAPTKDTTWDDVTIPARLLDKAVEALTGDLALLTESIELTALDLHFTDEQIQTFRIYRNVRVKTDPHGISGTYQLPKLLLKLHSPQDTAITVGATRRTLVDINAERESKVDVLIQSAKNELKEYVSNQTNGLGEKIEGLDGLFFYVKYSPYADGHVMTDAPDASTQYMGTCSAKLKQNVAPTDYRQYTWVKIRGEDGRDGQDGEDGIPGKPGADGKTQYLHIKYSNDGKTFTENNGEDLGAWIGTLVDFVQADSTNFGDYTWKKFTEDVDEELDSIRRTITEQYTQVLNDAESITMKALESYVETSAYETFKKTTESELKETSKQISMNFTTVTDQIKDVGGDLETVSEKLEKHFVFSEEGLVIKAGENSMSLLIDNDIIHFKKGNQEFGWWDGVNFHTGNIYVDVDQVAQFGSYGFVPFEDSTSDGLDLVRVGG